MAVHVQRTCAMGWRLLTLKVLALSPPKNEMSGKRKLTALLLQPTPAHTQPIQTKTWNVERHRQDLQ